MANEEEAYKYWLRTVRACLKAEEAYGPHVVYRLRYTDLVDNPESTLRSLLDFLGESYSAKCLEPLSQRINSSNVPEDFKRTIRLPIPQSWKRRGDFPLKSSKLPSLPNTHLLQPTSWTPSSWHE